MQSFALHKRIGVRAYKRYAGIVCLMALFPLKSGLIVTANCYQLYTKLWGSLPLEVGSDCNFDKMNENEKDEALFPLKSGLIVTVMENGC